MGKFKKKDTDERSSRYAKKTSSYNGDYTLDQFQPTPNQQDVVESIMWNDLTVVNAPSGVGKTSVTLWTALKLLKDNRYRKLIFVKNPAEVGDDQIGFLSGDKKDKLTAHYESTKRIFHQFISAGKLDSDISNGKIELTIPNYVLGATWDDSIIIIDEAQVMSPMTLKLLLERTGENSRVILLGDVKQTYAIKQRKNGIQDLIERITESDGNGYRYPIEEFIGYVELTTEDNQRSRLSKYITEIY